MVGRVRVFYTLGVGIFILGMLLVVGSASNQAAAASAEKSVYEKAKEQTNKGDKQSRDYLARVDAYLKAKGQGGPPQEVEVAESKQIGETKVRGKGRTPLWLKLYNEPDIKNHGDLDTYIVQRRRALDRLAKEKPDREIEVSISPSDFLDVATMWRLKEAHGLDVDAMTISFYRKDTGEYERMMGVGDPKDPGEQPYINFDKPAVDIESRICALLPVPPPGGTPIPRCDKLDVKVTWIRGKLRADKAAKLDTDPAVMLVDPITDLVDPHKGRAMDVDMVDMPKLLIKKKEQLEGRNSLR